MIRCDGNPRRAFQGLGTMELGQGMKQIDGRGAGGKDKLSKTKEEWA